MMDPQVRAALEQQDSRLHQKLLDYGRRRIEAAENRWSQRHDRYRESERLYRAFRNPDAQDQNTRDDELTQGVEKIVVPYSYAVLQSMLAFMMSTLTQRKPIIPVEAKGGHDARAAMLMEMLLDSQCNDMNPSYTLCLYQGLLDAFRYGVGIKKTLWTIEEWPEFQREVVPVVDPLTGQGAGMEERLTKRPVIAYEGNRSMNVSPYDFLPDPSRPLADFQRGEFVFHRFRRSRTELRQSERQGMYAGLKFLGKKGQQAGYGNGFSSDSGSDNARIMQMDSMENQPATDEYGEPYVTLHEGWCLLYPERLELPLGTGYDEEPTGEAEIWVITIANRSRVIRAENANLPARMFPFDIYEPNYDWHSPANHSMIEVHRGLQYYYSWLFNSRMQAVRKTLNNEMVIDPGMVNELDLLDPEPGRLIRLNREVWGDGRAKDAVFPIPVQDVTQGHLQDAAVVQNLIQTVMGSSNIMMGMPNPGRRSATENQGQMKMTAGRMAMLLEIWAQQSGKPHAKLMAKNTQAFLDLTHPIAVRQPFASILGGPYIQVTPDMLAGDFQYPFTDGGLPTDRTQEASVWKEFLMAGMQANPAMMQNLPWMTILARWLRAMGIRDLQSFGVSPLNFTMEPMPDEQVMQQAQAGNLVPMGQGLNTSPQPSDGFQLPTMNSTPGGGAPGHA